MMAVVASMVDVLGDEHALTRRYGNVLKQQEDEAEKREKERLKAEEEMRWERERQGRIAEVRARQAREKGKPEAS